MAFNENTRLKIPAILHLCSLGYNYVTLTKAKWDLETNIFTDIFEESIKRINPELEQTDIKRLLEDISLVLDHKDLGEAFCNMLVATSGTKLIEFKDLNNMDYVDDYIFDGGYILLAEDGSIMDEKGFPIVQFIWGKTWVNNHAHVLQPKIQNNNEYLFHLLKSISVVQIMTDSIQKKINQENLINVKAIYRDNTILDMFSKFATPIRKQLINVYKENQKLTELQDWLLPILMNGQVKVKNENETINGC